MIALATHQARASLFPLFGGKTTHKRFAQQSQPPGPCLEWPKDQVCFSGKQSSQSKVDAVLSALSPEETATLKEAFSTWLTRDFLGFTLLGTKPMSLLESHEDTASLPVSWQKILPVVSRDAYILRYIPGDRLPIFANKAACREKFAQHLERFQEVLGRRVTPEELVNSLELDAPIPAAKILKDDRLLGILLGYGKLNAGVYNTMMAWMEQGKLLVLGNGEILFQDSKTKRLSPSAARITLRLLENLLYYYRSRNPSASPKTLQEIEARIQSLAQRIQASPPQPIKVHKVFQCLQRIGELIPSDMKRSVDTGKLAKQQADILRNNVFQWPEAVYGTPDSYETSVLLPSFRATAADPEGKVMILNCLAKRPEVEAMLESKDVLRTVLLRLAQGPQGGKS